MKPPEITAGSRLRLHPCVAGRAGGPRPAGGPPPPGGGWGGGGGGALLWGCDRARRYLEVDDDTLSAVALLEEAPSLAEAEAALEHCTGEEYDVLALAEILAE